MNKLDLTEHIYTMALVSAALFSLRLNTREQSVAIKLSYEK